MLPGKKYNIEDLWQILRRRFWVILLPMALISAGWAAYSRTQPNRYTAETVIMVVPQQVPENYVRATVTARLEDRLPAIRTTILSRTRLERVIGEFDLYPEERRTGIMEDVVALMRRDIEVQTTSGNAFRVRYTGREPEKVMKVADALANLFINESIRDRQQQAEGTNQFLERELVDAKSRLLEQERRLTNWKLSHAGELPTQLDANVQQMQNTQMALRDVRETMNRDRDRRLLLERQLEEAQVAGPGDVVLAPAPGDPALTATASGVAQQLAAAQAQLVGFEERGLKPGHPDLEAGRRRVQDLQARLNREMATSTSSAAGPAVSPAEALRLRRIADVKNQITEIDRQIARNQEEESRLQVVALEAQRRVDAIPTRESELIELTRDYETLSQAYNNLLANKQQSQIAANLENRQVGERFKPLDPAQMPEKPSSPNRPRDIGLGLLAGLALGLGLVGLIEYRDTTFKTDEDVAGVLELPVLAVVPVMKSDEDVRRSLWTRVFVSTGLGGIVAACLTFVAYVLVS